MFNVKRFKEEKLMAQLLQICKPTCEKIEKHRLETCKPNVLAQNTHDHTPKTFFGKIDCD